MNIVLIQKAQETETVPTQPLYDINVVVAILY